MGTATATEAVLMTLLSIPVERRAVLALRLTDIYWQSERTQVTGVVVTINGAAITLPWNEEVLATLQEDES
jgi:hypothetical protein